MIGHVTYLSDVAMAEKFGRELNIGNFSVGEKDPIEFQIESYLNYQGDKFADDFDANAYILITKMLDYFDLSRDYQNDPAAAFKHASCNFMVISFTSDWRFPAQRSREITDALIGAGRNVSYAEIQSDQGHDAFLLPNPRYEEVLSGYLSRVADQLKASTT
jgi:homoserine O-acetyltransferase